MLRKRDFADNFFFGCIANVFPATRMRVFVRRRMRMREWPGVGQAQSEILKSYSISSDAEWRIKKKRWPVRWPGDLWTMEFVNRFMNIHSGKFSARIIRNLFKLPASHNSLNFICLARWKLSDNTPVQGRMRNEKFRLHFLKGRSFPPDERNFAFEFQQTLSGPLVIQLLLSAAFFHLIEHSNASRSGGKCNKLAVSWIKFHSNSGRFIEQKRDKLLHWMIFNKSLNASRGQADLVWKS